MEQPVPDPAWLTKELLILKQQLSTPTWLTKELLTECLQNKEGNNKIIVEDFKAFRAVPPAFNYGSYLLRITLEYRDGYGEEELRTLSLIIKSETTEGPNKNLVDDLCEPAFYKRFVPEANKFTDMSFVPKHFFSPIATTTILEDLSEQGFVMINKDKQLDFDHCRLFAIAAATLHAVSFAVHKECPELVESVGKERLFAKETKLSVMYKNMIIGGMENVAEGIEKIDKFKRFSKVVRGISPLLWDLLVEAYKPSEVLNTLNHGDAWTPNMMFKYDDKRTVSKIKLLDFQGLRYGSPVNDIVHFVWTSANCEVLGRLDELYHTYLAAFNDKLRQFNCGQSLSYENFMNIVKKLSPLAIFSVAIAHPFYREREQIDLSPFFKENADADVISLYKKYYDEDYQSGHFTMIVEHLESTGVFGHLEEFLK